MIRIIALAIGLAALWLLLSGYFDKPLLLGFGAFSVVLTVFLSVRLGVVDSEGVPIGMFPGVVIYWFWLLVEIGKANFAVAFAALSPELKIRPKTFWVEATPQTDAGDATLANSITLTPGTVSIDVYRGQIFVHALTEELADPEGIAEMSRRICNFEAKSKKGGGAP